MSGSMCGKRTATCANEVLPYRRLCGVPEVPACTAMMPACSAMARLIVHGNGCPPIHHPSTCHLPPPPSSS